MKINLKRFYFIFNVFTVLNLCCQVPENLKSISARKITLPKYYRHSVYLKIDLVREIGIGYNRNINSFFELDVDVNFITPKPFQGANDYFYNYGYSLNFAPKLFLQNRVLFLGPSISFLNYGYNKTWAESQVGTYNHDLSYQHDFRDRKSIEFASGGTIGTNCNLNKAFFQLFLTVNYIFYDRTTITVYKHDDGRTIIKYNDPIVKNYDLSKRLYACAGVKFGIGRKKVENPRNKLIIENLNAAFASNDSILALHKKTNNVLKSGLVLNYHYKKSLNKYIRRSLYLHPKTGLDEIKYKKLIDINSEFTHYFLFSDSIIKNLYHNYQFSNDGKRAYFSIRRSWYEKLKWSRYYSAGDTVKSQNLMNLLKKSITEEIQKRTMKPRTYKLVIIKNGKEKVLHIRKDYYALRNREKYKELYEKHRIN